MKLPPRRCAVYTRKSSEEGLEQDFNSLHAQREACASYVKSQASEGWRLVSTRYDDGGFSGGSMERPALQRLLAAVAAGEVEVVVVYKIDRLTRALADFARIVEIFDRHAVSFVSVTQAFNTTNSMGRLTLNMLLSFAQFEREITGERIRDKIAASKAKGMWMGGNLPFGYDLPEAGRRALVVNEVEAAVVRRIFETYLELGSVRAVEASLARQGLRTRRRGDSGGRSVGGKPFNRGALFHMLRNRIYLGMIVHRDRAHPGLHRGIVDPELFQAVQDRLAANARRSGPGQGERPRAPLVGRIFDALGRPMTPSVAYGRGGKRYRYYVSPAGRQARAAAEPDQTIRRIPAPALEARLAEMVRSAAPLAMDDPLALLLRVEIYPEAVHLLMPVDLLPGMRSRLNGTMSVERDAADPARLRLTAPIRMQFFGGRTCITGSATPPARPDPALVRALRAAHALVRRDARGTPDLAAAPASTYERRLVRLAFLAPELQRGILAGRQRPDLTLASLLDAPIPLLWSEQIRRFGPQPKP